MNTNIMRNPFTRFVWLTVFFIAVLAIGIAKTLAADSLPEGSNGVAGVTVPDGADAPGGSGAVAPSAPVASGELGVAGVNAAKWQGLMAVMLPLIIAFFKSHIPEDKRKWIPVVAPVLGEIVSAVLTNLPHGTGAVAGLAAVGLREVKDQHLPGDGGSGQNKGGNSNGIVTAMGIAFVLLFFCGGLTACAPLKPGADPLVVRAEQTETLASSTFGLFLHLENDQRDFYRTNAPALHAWAEWLREPQTINGITYPRADAMVVSLNSVKRTYKANRLTDPTGSSSNLLVTAIATISESARQASSWMNVITNKTAATSH